VKRAALPTATNFADVLVVVPQVVTTDTAVLTFIGGTLYKDAAASSLIAPAVASRGFVTTTEGKFSNGIEA
jgi:hypothetical protein